MGADRIEALERAVLQLAELAAATASATAAQGVVCRAVADLLAEGGGSLDDVRDRALDMATIIGGDLPAAVRTILAAAPSGTGVMQ